MLWFCLVEVIVVVNLVGFVFIIVICFLVFVGLMLILSLWYVWGFIK